MKKTLIYFPTILLVIFSIILINVASVEAINVFPKGPHFKLMEKLSKEQQEEVKNKVKELWGSGASREEIRDTVKKMFEDYDVDFPDDMKGFLGRRGPKPGRGLREFSDQLTNEQRAAIREKAKTMHEQGISREEIHTQIGNMLKEYGIDVPDNFGQHREMWKNLSDVQRKTIREKMREMREEGATRVEIREKIHKMIQEFEVKESDDQTNVKAETSGENLSIRSYPNPFNPETNIEYNLKSNAQVTIYIYDIQGKRVRSLGDNYRQAGTYTVRWDGMNESGTQVPSAVYFIRVSAGNETLNHRIVMMK